MAKIKSLESKKKVLLQKSGSLSSKACVSLALQEESKKGKAVSRYKSTAELEKVGGEQDFSVNQFGQPKVRTGGNTRLAKGQNN